MYIFEGDEMKKSILLGPGIPAGEIIILGGVINEK